MSENLKMTWLWKLTNTRGVDEKLQKPEHVNDDAKFTVMEIDQLYQKYQMGSFLEHREGLLMLNLQTLSPEDFNVSQNQQQSKTTQT